MVSRWETSVDALVEEACRKEALDDFGTTTWREPLGVLVDDYAGAGLSELGVHIIRSGLVHSLRMRLRAVEWRRREPAIGDQQVTAPIVVVGMMRSGTTLVQRLLAADPRFRFAAGWEVIEAAPRPGGDPAAADPDPRIAAALARQEQTQQFMPDLFAIHPMYALEAEEEIVFLADAFLSHVPEAGAHLPHYRAWIDGQDFTPAYQHLRGMLQLIQWQQLQRGVGGERWVLKTPAHLGYLDTLRATFPDLHVVHLHRDPVASIASGASLNATLHGMHSDAVDATRLGEEWLERMGWTNDRALAVRSDWEPGLVTDLHFENVVADPIGEISRVYDAVGLDLAGEAETAMRAWLERRPREAGRPAYRPETYGLTTDRIKERFADYERKFR